MKLASAQLSVFSKLDLTEKYARMPQPCHYPHLPSLMMAESSASPTTAIASEPYLQMITTIKDATESAIKIYTPVLNKYRTELMNSMSDPTRFSNDKAVRDAIAAKIDEVNKQVQGTQDILLLLNNKMTWINTLQAPFEAEINRLSDDDALRFADQASGTLQRENLRRVVQVTKVIVGLGLERAPEWKAELEGKLKVLEEKF